MIIGNPILIKDPRPSVTSYLYEVSVKIPKSKRIFFHYRHEGKSKKYFLSIPETVFKIFYFMKDGRYHFNCMYIAFLVENKIFSTPFHNVDNGGKVCLGIYSKSTRNLEELINDCIKNFWSKDFSDSLDDNYLRYNRKRSSLISTYNKWQKNTKENPEWTPSEKDLLENEWVSNNFKTSIDKEFLISKTQTGTNPLMSIRIQ